MKWPTQNVRLAFSAVKLANSLTLFSLVAHLRTTFGVNWFHYVYFRITRRRNSEELLCFRQMKGTPGTPVSMNT